MILNSLGIKRRFSIDTITQQGDEKTHNLAKARPYRDYLKNLEWNKPGLRAPTPDDLNAGSYSADILRDFMRWGSSMWTSRLISISVSAPRISVYSPG